MIQNIFIIGATGKVGRELVKQVYQFGDSDAKRHENPTKIIGVASGKDYSFCRDGLIRDDLWADKKEYSDLEDLLNVVSPIENEVIYIDVTNAGKQMYDFHKKVINETKHKIVTANKTPLVIASTKEFRTLTSDPHRYGYRCSLMAGADALYWIRKSVDLGEKIICMTGVLSGTLAFICSELNNGEDPSETIIQAVEKGYSEPDVRMDLRGTDIANKAVILARTAGFDINLEDIELRPFIPEEMLSYMNEKGVWADPRMQDLFDIEYKMKAQDSHLSGNALVYRLTLVAKKGIPKISIGLESLPSGHLFNTGGTDNRLLIETDRGFFYDSGPVKGAGIGITARNIRSDLIDLQTERKVAYPALYP
jgi:homoserine dehydrogenase